MPRFGPTSFGDRAVMGSVVRVFASRDGVCQCRVDGCPSSITLSAISRHCDISFGLSDRRADVTSDTSDGTTDFIAI